MNFVFETAAETHKSTLAAAGVFAENYLVAIERLTQLNLEVTRTAFERSSELTLACLDACTTTKSPFAWNPLAKANFL